MPVDVMPRIVSLLQSKNNFHLRMAAGANPSVGFHAELSRFFHREVSHL